MRVTSLVVALQKSKESSAKKRREILGPPLLIETPWSVPTVFSFSIKEWIPLHTKETGKEKRGRLGEGPVKV